MISFIYFYLFNFFIYSVREREREREEDRKPVSWREEGRCDSRGFPVERMVVWCVKSFSWQVADLKSFFYPSPLPPPPLGQSHRPVKLTKVERSMAQIFLTWQLRIYEVHPFFRVDCGNLMVKITVRPTGSSSSSRRQKQQFCLYSIKLKRIFTSN